MKKYQLNKILSVFFIILCTFAFSVSTVSALTAADLYCSTSSSTYSNDNISSDNWSLVRCGGIGQHCCDFREAMTLINRLINWFISISVTVAAITFSIAGARLLINPENASEREKAKEMFKKTIIGMFIVLGAWLIVHTLVSALAGSSSKILYFLGQ